VFRVKKKYNEKIELLKKKLNYTDTSASAEFLTSTVLEDILCTKGPWTMIYQCKDFLNFQNLVDM
jgi:hypothetical protein